MDASVMKKLLERVRLLEAEVYEIQQTKGLRKEYPQTFQVLEEARDLLRLAFVKISEGDRQQ